MSFSTQVKDEIIRIRHKDPRVRLSQLSGLTLSCGSLRLGSKPAVIYQTECLPVAKHIAALASSLFELDTQMELKSQEHRKQPLIVVTFSGADVKKLLLHTGALKEDAGGIHLGEDIPHRRISDEECKRAFIRGCFLGSGSCVNPKRSYHMEIICRSVAFAEQLQTLFDEFSLPSKTAVRKDRAIMYIKDGDSVMGFLALIGSNVGAMELENVRIEKEMRNYINRTSNCENANMDKSAHASAKQYQAIMQIMGGMDISKLPRPLLQAAQLRLSHPEATLAELAQMANIQKSGMNHRMDRLIKIAKELD